MPISFGRKNNLPAGRSRDGAARIAALHPDCHLMVQARASLVDLRSPEAFRTGFIPGSYNVPDLACVTAARHTGLFKDRKIYLLADDPEQLQMCSESGALAPGVEVAGWFSADAIEEWQKVNPEIGSLEAIDSDTLFIRMATWNTLILDVYENGEERAPSHPAALRFCFNDLPLSLDGLPAQSSICLTAGSSGMASFAASLLWNFGFHRISYLNGGCRTPFPLAE